MLVTGGAGFLGSQVAAALVGHPGVELVVAGDVRRPEHPREGVVYDDCDVTRPPGLAPLLERHRHRRGRAPRGDREPRSRPRPRVPRRRGWIAQCPRGMRRRPASTGWWSPRSGAAYGYHPDSPEWLHESDPLRGNDEFPYSRHKRLVEEMLAELPHLAPRARAGRVPDRHDPRPHRAQPDHRALGRIARARDPRLGLAVRVRLGRRRRRRDGPRRHRRPARASTTSPATARSPCERSPRAWASRC